MPDRRIDLQNPMGGFGDVSDADEDMRKDEANSNDAAKTCDNFIIDSNAFYMMTEEEKDQRAAASMGSQASPDRLLEMSGGERRYGGMKLAPS